MRPRSRCRITPDARDHAREYHHRPRHRVPNARIALVYYYDDLPMARTHSGSFGLRSRSADPLWNENSSVCSSLVRFFANASGLMFCLCPRVPGEKCLIASGCCVFPMSPHERIFLDLFHSADTSNPGSSTIHHPTHSRSRIPFSLRR